jgi:VWFA-related protein
LIGVELCVDALMMIWSNRRLRLALVLVIGAIVSAVLPGEFSPPRNSFLTLEAAQQEGERAVFGIEIEEVTIPVTVTDAAEEFVIDLKPSDFRVLDNEKDQRILGVQLSSDPISIVLVVETSSRVETLLPEIGRSGISFTQLVMGESGEAAIIAFDSEIRIVQDFTPNPDRIETALKSLQPGGEDVRLSDALSRALALLQTRPDNRRKAIIAISEARDNGSANPPGFVLRSAQHFGTSVYTITLSSTEGMLQRAGQPPANPFPPGTAARPQPSNYPPTPDAQGRLGAANVSILPLIEEFVSSGKILLGSNPLSLFAQGTGAEQFIASGNAMGSALSRIGRELRSQYLITYRPSNLGEPGYHQIRVSVAPAGLRARALPGYMFTQQSRPSIPDDSGAPPSSMQD